jgi:peptidoglycan/LPS O-acetylase OafA/YrhL
MSNPYAAPVAKLDVLADTPPPRKPKAVTLLQVWIIVIMALLAVGFMKNLHNIDGRASLVLFGIDGKTRGYLMAAIIGFVLVTLCALDMRAWPGRVMGLLVIGLSAAPAYLQLFMPQMRLPMPMELARWLTIGVFCLPFVYWGYAFNFSARARGYFGQDPD